MSTEDKADRRSFLKTSVGVGAAAAAAFPVPQVMADTAAGANERIGVGFIGVGGRSGAHQSIVQNFQKQGVTQPVAVCDVYRPRLVAASQRLGNAKMYDEHERLLDDPPYNYFLNTAPNPAALGQQDPGEEGVKAACHWHLEILPRHTAVAGFEWGTDAPGSVGEFLSPGRRTGYCCGAGGRDLSPG